MNAASKNITINYIEFSSIADLSESNQCLLKKAIEVLDSAYAPYSNFKVGAAIELINGQIVTGSNQENIAYPSGLCAERVALFSASANFPKTAIKTIAIAAKTEKGNITAVSPCGACRQVMAEYENLSNNPIQVLFLNGNGKILLFESVNSLLPFQFTM